jgi:hypothetical protein
MAQAGLKVPCQAVDDAIHTETKDLGKLFISDTFGFCT